MFYTILHELRFVLEKDEVEGDYVKGHVIAECDCVGTTIEEHQRILVNKECLVVVPVRLKRTQMTYIESHVEEINENVTSVIDKDKHYRMHIKRIRGWTLGEYTDFLAVDKLMMPCKINIQGTFHDKLSRTVCRFNVNVTNSLREMCIDLMEPGRNRVQADLKKNFDQRYGPDVITNINIEKFVLC